MERQKSSFLEPEKRQMKLIPEDRKMELRIHMYVELKALEMERRKRVALESTEKCKSEREEREKATESLRRQKEEDQERMRQEADKREEEEERRANDQQALEKTKQEQLKKERLQWKKVMMVEEEPVERPKSTSSALKREQLKSPELLTSDLKTKEQVKRQTLYNNWVGEQKPVSEPVNEKLHPNSATYLLFAAKPRPQPEETTEAPKSKETLQLLQGKLKVGYWIDKCRDHCEKKAEKRKLKIEGQYARWAAAKERDVSRFSHRFDHYIQEYALDRNSILKSIF